MKTLLWLKLYKNMYNVFKRTNVSVEPSTFIRGKWKNNSQIRANSFSRVNDRIFFCVSSIHNFRNWNPRSFNKIMLNTARHRRHLHFNHRCKDLQVLPPSLRIKPPVRTPKGWKLAKNVGLQFLKLPIEETHKKIRSLTREKEFALDFLRSRLATLRP